MPKENSSSSIEKVFRQLEEILNFIDNHRDATPKQLNDEIMSQVYLLEEQVDEFARNASQKFPQAPTSEQAFRRELRKMTPEIAEESIKLHNMANTLRERIRRMNTWLEVEGDQEIKKQTAIASQPLVTASEFDTDDRTAKNAAPPPEKPKSKYKQFRQSNWKKL